MQKYMKLFKLFLLTAGVTALLLWSLQKEEQPKNWIMCKENCKKYLIMSKEKPPFEQIRIVEPIITFNATYSNENKIWLQENLGKTFKAYRSCFNYYMLENGFYCHVYQAMSLTNP